MVKKILSFVLLLLLAFKKTRAHNGCNVKANHKASRLALLLAQALHTDNWLNNQINELTQRDYKHVASFHLGDRKD